MCSCNNGMGELATLNGLGAIATSDFGFGGMGLGDADTTLDFTGTLWAQQPNQYPQVAGQSTDVGAQSTGYDWNNVWRQGVTSLFSIAKARYGGPQPGQFMQSGSNIAYALPKGATSFNFSSFPSGMGVSSGISGLMPLLLIGGVAVVALKAIK